MAKPIHPLKEWMRLHKVDNAELAQWLKSDLNPESIRQIASGYRRPSWDLAFEIASVVSDERITAVTLRDARLYKRKPAGARRSRKRRAA